MQSPNEVIAEQKINSCYRRKQLLRQKERLEREAKEREERAAAERKRKEARRPDRVKLLEWTDIITNVATPAMKTKEGDQMATACKTMLMTTLIEMRKKIKEL